MSKLFKSISAITTAVLLTAAIPSLEAGKAEPKGPNSASDTGLSTAQKAQAHQDIANAKAAKAAAEAKVSAAEAKVSAAKKQASDDISDAKEAAAPSLTPEQQLNLSQAQDAAGQ